MQDQDVQKVVNEEANAAEQKEYDEQRSQADAQQANAEKIESGQKLSKEPTSAGLTKINREFQEKSAMRHAKELELPYINLAKTPLNPDFLQLIPLEKAKVARAVSFFKVGNKVRIAVEDPSNSELGLLVDSFKAEGMEVDLSLASSAGIDEALDHYEAGGKYKELEIVKEVDESKIQSYEKEVADLDSLGEKLAALPAPEGLNLINLGAMKTGVSDVHYEPAEGRVNVRFRIDGVLHKVFEMRPEVYENIANQLKYVSKMQVNVFKIPQDGRYSFDYNERKIAVRVASIPTPFGESFVCRYLVGNDSLMSLEDLGFEGIALAKLQKATEIAQGMVLVTGPTGSGKTTTLYTLLGMMSAPENKVITLEDPVEYQLPGITQSQIDENKGYNFADGLRSILRHDPNVVMLGEIRDLETAETAAQAALTGHVLLSTLHTNSAIETIPRLINMGLPSFMTAPSLNTIVAQRLVRKVCSECVEKRSVSDSQREEFEKIAETVGPDFVVPTELPVVKGCDACSNTGFKGRLVISEVISLSDEMKSLILNGASSVDLMAAARKEGIITMREDGFMKVAKGLTTLEEVYRETNVMS